MDVAKVFAVITRRLVAKADDLCVLAATTYSFEEWVNWEALLACFREGWIVDPKPAYRSIHEGEAERELGDLLVMDRAKQSRILVEVAVVHDYTSEKWIGKIDNDTQKLDRAAHSGLCGLQLVVAASTKRITGNPKWEQWLARTARWRAVPPHADGCDLPGSGQLSLWGWEVSRTSGPISNSRRADASMSPPACG